VCVCLRACARVLSRAPSPHWYCTVEWSMPASSAMKVLRFGITGLSAASDARASAYTCPLPA
jgi:hypothetical protein